MPAKNDATTPELPDDQGTEPESPVAAPGNVETAELLHDLEATQDLVLKQEEMIQALAERLDGAERRLNGTPDEVANPEANMPAPLPEGWKRYSSRFTELTMVKIAGRRIYVDGVAVFEPHVHVDFSGGVYETGDPAIQEWLEEQPAYGVDYWEDETAVKRHSQIEVQTGVKSTTTPSPRAPLVAPMQ